MKLGLTNVYGRFNEVVEVSTIEQLIELMKKYKHPIILEENPFYRKDYWREIPREYRDCEYTIEVYDDYRE